jgi:methylenetetrahydrofolate reductase (NADPH)
MAQGRFVITMELTPPRVPDLDSLEARLEKSFLGVADAINVTDCASAMLRMSSLGGCLACLKAGAEPILQLTCRDRNRLALQAELITAAITPRLSPSMTWIRST